jgi:hypothetical protein
MNDYIVIILVKFSFYEDRSAFVDKSLTIFKGGGLRIADPLIGQLPGKVLNLVEN